MKKAFDLKAIFHPVQLTRGACWKTILLFSLPIIVSYLLQQVYSISDAAIVGQTLTADEVAGVTDTTPLVFVFLQFAFGSSAGFCAVTSCRVGTHDDQGVRRSLATQFVLSTVLTVVLTALALALLNPMLAWINVTPDSPAVYNAAHTYCMIIFSGIGAQLFYNFICSFLRSMGDSATPQLRLGREDWRITWRDVSRHLIQGVPLGLQFSVLSIGIIVMQGVVVQFDILDGVMVSNAAQNGFGAAHKLNNLLMTPFNGLGSAMTSFAAQNLGAGDYARIRKGTLQALIIAAVITAVMVGTGLLLTINGAYLHIFLSADKVTPETIRYGNAYLHIDLAMYPFLAFIFVMRNCVQGIGRPQFILGAGTAELVARVTVCLLLPPDPVAWMSADAVLSVPFIRNILRSDYRYFYHLDK